MNEDYNYFQNEQFRKSLTAYEDMLASGKHEEFDAETLTDIAEYYSMEQRTDDANRCIQYALSFYPDSVDPQIFLSRQQMFANNEAKAWFICRRISDQNDREVLFLKAELYFYFNKTEQGFQLLMKAYSECDEEQEAADLLYDSICLCRDYELNQKALEWVMLLRSEHPDYADIDVLEAEVRNVLGEHEAAIRLAEGYLENNPYDTHAWMQLAEAHLMMEHYEEATEAVDYVLAIDSENAEALIMRGNILFDTEHPHEAHEYYTRFLGYFPNDERVRYLDAECLMDMGQYEAAMRRLSS